MLNPEVGIMFYALAIYYLQYGLKTVIQGATANFCQVYQFFLFLICMRGMNLINYNIIVLYIYFIAII